MRKETVRDELWELSMDLHVLAARLEFLDKIPRVVDPGTCCPPLSPIVRSLQQCSAELSKAAALCSGTSQLEDPRICDPVTDRQMYNPPKDPQP